MNTRQHRNLKKGIKFIEGDDITRQNKYLANIQETLNQFDCVMVPEFIISGDKIQTRVAIVAKPRIIQQ